MRHQQAALGLAAAPDWHKSSHSDDEDQNGCVEVGTVPGLVGVRDTKLGATSPTLAFTDTEWSAFLDGVRGSEV